MRYCRPGACRRTRVGRFLPSVLLFLYALKPVQVSADEGLYWVFFTDRGPMLSERLASREEVLRSSPAWERRIAVGLYSADQYDLPPWEGYVDAVEEAAGPVRVRSRYLNAVSLEASPFAVADLFDLPFVERILPVGRSSLEPLPGTLLATGAGLSSSQLSQIGLDSLHARGWKGAGVILGVMDTGFDLDHPAFEGIDVLDQYDFLNDDPDPSQQPEDYPGQSEHGTKVLSIIGAFAEDIYSGGAPDASFLLAKTEDISDEYQEEEDLWVMGLEWLEEGGALIVSSSLAYLDWYTYEDLDGNTAVTTIAADLAASRGTMVYNAIGNEGPGPGSLMAPSDGDSVFAVGAVDPSGNVPGFSSRGPTFDGRIKPDACARGQYTVFVSWQGTGYSSGSGTSFATPLMSSTAAVLADAHPEWTIFDIAEAIRTTASRSSNPDNAFGWGIADAYAALMYRSVTGCVRWSDTGEVIPGYPLSIQVSGAAPVEVLTNDKGWFAVEPGALGSYTVSGAGGPGSLIEVSGELDSAGVDIPLYADPLQSRTGSSVFPNPSTEGVYVGFDVESGPVNVILSVHTITGEEIHAQERSLVPSGIYRAPLPGEAFFWDGRDGTGDNAASGVYFARLVIGDVAEILKFSLVR